MLAITRFFYLQTILLLLSVPAQAAGVYKWTDARGQTNYDDTHLLAERLTRDYLNRRVVSKQPVLLVPGDFIAEIKKQCQLSKERLAQYRGAGTIYVRNEYGQSLPESADQRRKTLAEFTQEERDYCQSNAAQKLWDKALSDQRNEQVAVAQASKVKRIPVEKR
jgi:DNA-binding transcriptional regulator YiaG